MVVSTGKILTMNILVDFITLDDDNQIFRHVKLVFRIIPTATIIQTRNEFVTPERYDQDIREYENLYLGEEL